jgi:hypothetical protein
LLSDAKYSSTAVGKMDGELRIFWHHLSIAKLIKGDFAGDKIVSALSTSITKGGRLWTTVADNNIPGTLAGLHVRMEVLLQFCIIT